MSFSRDVKLEIIENKTQIKHYKSWMLLGMLHFSQHFQEKEISLRTRFIQTGEFYQELIHSVFSEDIHVKIAPVSNSFRIWVVQKSHRLMLLDLLENKLDTMTTPEERYAYLSGVFLACGNITNPQKSYHLEFITPNEFKGKLFLEILKKDLPSLKETRRRNRMVLYSKECGQIQDALTMMGASSASLKMIEVEMYKNIRNHANRVTNCETANIDKTVDASTQQVEDIQLVLMHTERKSLPRGLVETGDLRLGNPYASLRELAEISPSPISRSGLNHRLNTFREMAKTIRNNEKEKCSV